MIRKETKNLGVLLIKPVEKALAKEMIIKNHYSHKWNEGGYPQDNFEAFTKEKRQRFGAITRRARHGKNIVHTVFDKQFEEKCDFSSAQYGKLHYRPKFDEYNDR